MTVEGGSVTVLIIEDEPLLRSAFRALLEVSGYRVLEAGTAREALDCAAANRPDLVLLDLGLPDRHGLEVAAELRHRAETRDVPIVAMTGSGAPGTARDCAAAGCIDHLVKPIGPRDLLRRIPAWLQPRATDGPAGTQA